MEINLLTVDEVSRIFIIGKQTIYKMIKSGDLKAFRLNSDGEIINNSLARPWSRYPWRIPESVVAEYMESHTFKSSKSRGNDNGQ